MVTVDKMEQEHTETTMVTVDTMEQRHTETTMVTVDTWTHRNHYGDRRHVDTLKPL